MLKWRIPVASATSELVVVFPVPGVPVTSTFGRSRLLGQPPFCALSAIDQLIEREREREGERDAGDATGEG
jgi:hypothetical protein